jgi:hypothetical protein
MGHVFSWIEIFEVAEIEIEGTKTIPGFTSLPLLLLSRNSPNLLISTIRALMKKHILKL